MLQSKKDKQANTEGVVEIPNGDGSKDEIVKGVCENVKWQMKQDRKSTELKQLQGHIFKEAYKNGGVSAELVLLFVLHPAICANLKHYHVQFL